MAVFSTDQVRNLYVVEAYNTVTPVAPIGTMQVVGTTEGVDVTKVEQLNFSKSIEDYRYETVVRNHTILNNKFLKT